MLSYLIEICYIFNDVIYLTINKHFYINFINNILALMPFLAVVRSVLCCDEFLQFRFNNNNFFQKL